SFYNRYDNLRSVEPGPAPSGLPITFGNGVKGNTYGAEISTRVQPWSWWQLRAGYTLLRKDLRVKNGSGDQSKGKSDSNDPKYQLLVQSSMQLPKGFNFGF